MSDVLEKSFEAGLSLFEEVGTWMNIRTILYQLSHKLYISVCNLCRVCQDFCHMDRHCYLCKVVSILFIPHQHVHVSAYSGIPSCTVGLTKIIFEIQTIKECYLSLHLYDHNCVSTNEIIYDHCIHWFRSCTPNIFQVKTNHVTSDPLW